MDSTTSKQYDRFIRVQRFGVENAADFPENSTVRKLFADLDLLIAELAAAAASQDTGARRAATLTKNRTREALIDDLKAIARTSRTVAKTVPELRGKFTLSNTPSDKSLLSTARAFTNYATPHREKFIELDLPENFLEDLAADVEAFANAANNLLGELNNRSAATQTLRDAIRRGLSTVGNLDTVIQNRFRGNNLKLKEWERAKTRRTSVGRGPAQAKQRPENTTSTPIAA